MGRIALLADVPDVPCEIPGHEEWTRERFDAMKESLERLARQMRNVGAEAEHPWRGSRLTSVTARKQRAVAGLCEKLLDLPARRGRRRRPWPSFWTLPSR